MAEAEQGLELGALLEVSSGLLLMLAELLELLEACPLAGDSLVRRPDPLEPG